MGILILFCRLHNNYLLLFRWIDSFLDTAIPTCTYFSVNQLFFNSMMLQTAPFKCILTSRKGIWFSCLKQLSSPRPRILRENGIFSQLVMRFLVFYRARKCITIFTNNPPYFPISSHMNGICTLQSSLLQFNILLPSISRQSKFSLYFCHSERHVAELALVPSPLHQ